MLPTVIFAAVLSLTSVVPLASDLDFDFARWVRVLQAEPSELTAWQNLARFVCLCSLAGAWLGVYSLALDWDTRWQQWPRPCMAGSIVGATVGCLIGGMTSSGASDAS